MKRLMTVWCCGLGVAGVMLAGVEARAQGTVQFANSTLSKLKYSPDFVTTVDLPLGFNVGLFWGTTTDNLTLSTPVTPIYSPGLFSAGIAYPIVGTQEGQRVYLKIAAWNASAGTDFRSATMYGESAVVQATLGPTAGPGTVIWQSASGTNPDRMKPFAIWVPEPSVVALGGLAGVGFMMTGRRRWRAKL